MTTRLSEEEVHALHTTNVAGGEWWTAHRARMEQYFVPEHLTTTQVHYDPSGRYELRIETYQTGKHTWSYTRGVVVDTATQQLVADIKRNYSHFWHAWYPHPNGNLYLLCGEDYQGYTVVNVTAGTIKTFLPKAANEGVGFCWTDCEPDLEEQTLRVEGCFWGGPYERVVFDFRTPETLPLPELERSDLEYDDEDEDEL